MTSKLSIMTTLSLTLLSHVSARSLNTKAETSHANIFARGVGGISCDGSARCVDYKGNGLQDLLSKVNQIDINKIFQSGEQLACSDVVHSLIGYGGICVSVGHNTESYTIGPLENGQSNSVGDVIADLIWHGCKACGTAPTNRQGNNLADGSGLYDEYLWS